MSISFNIQSSITTSVARVSKRGLPWDMNGQLTFVPELGQVSLHHRLGRAENCVLANVTSEVVPGVPSHLRRPRQAIAESKRACRECERDKQRHRVVKNGSAETSGPPLAATHDESLYCAKAQETCELQRATRITGGSVHQVLLRSGAVR